MRTLVVPVERLTEAHVGHVLVHDMEIDDGGRRVRLPKGRLLAVDDLALLRRRFAGDLRLIEIGPGDLHEEAAGLRLARAVAGEGLVIRKPVEGQVPLAAAVRGVLLVDAGLLAAVNALPGVAVLTLLDGMTVDTGKKVAAVKVAPLVISEQVVIEAERLCRRALAVRIAAFRPLRVAVVDRDPPQGTRRARYDDALRRRIEWFGGELVRIQLPRPEDVEANAGALVKAAHSAQLVVVMGTGATNPEDPAVRGLLAAGGEVLRRGLPVHPGSTYWLGQLSDQPVLGIASCGMISEATAFDLLLPRFFAGLPVDAPFLAGLGHGGLLDADMHFRLPPYSRRTRGG